MTQMKYQITVSTYMPILFLLQELIKKMTSPAAFVNIHVDLVDDPPRRQHVHSTKMYTTTHPFAEERKKTLGKPVYLYPVFLV